MIQALIFDFDGLILDTEISALQSWQEIYQEHLCELPMERWTAGIGGKTFDACSYLETLVGHPLEREAILTRRRRRHMELVLEVSALPGVEAYLADARRLGLSVGLASSSSREWVMDHLSRLGLDAYFDRMSCGDEVANKKPHPELYLSVLASLGIPAENAVAFEDSPNGVLAAQRAGIFCIAIPNVITGQLSLDHADMQMNSMADMPLEALLIEVEQRRES